MYKHYYRIDGKLYIKFYKKKKPRKISECGLYFGISNGKMCLITREGRIYEELFSCCRYCKVSVKENPRAFSDYPIILCYNCKR